MLKIKFMQDNNEFELVEKKINRISKWVSIVEKTVLVNSGDKELYHSLAQDDYVTVLGLTDDNKVPIVKQYRPAVNSISIELPGGLLDKKGESPASAARRELYEETGYTSSSEIINLGCLDPDTGRLENKLWCFFLPNIKFDHNWTKEKGVDTSIVEIDLLKKLILNNQFKQALHIAIIGLASLKGLI